MILEFAINLLTSVSRSGILIKQMEYFSELNVGVISLCMYRAKMSNILQFQIFFFFVFFPITIFEITYNITEAKICYQSY